MKEKAEIPPSLIDHLPWDGNSNPIWPASSFILRRNSAKYVFPPKQDRISSQQTLDVLNNILLQSPDLEQPVLLKAESLSPLDKEFLFEHFICSDSFQDAQEGQGFVVDSTGRFLALLNVQDHLQMMIIDCKKEWDQSWSLLTKLEQALSKNFDFAFSNKFGYLTSDPMFCGTGLSVLVYLHLPALNRTSRLPEALKDLKGEGVAAMGMQGNLENLIGDLVVLSNYFTLGITEEQILNTIHSSAMKLMVSEKTLRNQLQQEKNGFMKDLVCRAYGLLMHSCQLHTKEALDALSLIKLGIDLGWITGISDSLINSVFFKCQRAHLLHAIKEVKPELQDLPQKRAEFIHLSLQGIQLNA